MWGIIRLQKRSYACGNGLDLGILPKRGILCICGMTGQIGWRCSWLFFAASEHYKGRCPQHQPRCCRLLSGIPQTTLQGSLEQPLGSLAMQPKLCDASQCQIQSTHISIWNIRIFHHRLGEGICSCGDCFRSPVSIYYNSMHKK